MTSYVTSTIYLRIICRRVLTVLFDLELELLWKEPIESIKYILALSRTIPFPPLFPNNPASYFVQCFLEALTASMSNITLYKSQFITSHFKLLGRSLNLFPLAFETTVCVNTFSQFTPPKSSHYFVHLDQISAQPYLLSENNLGLTFMIKAESLVLGTILENLFCTSLELHTLLKVK